MGDGRSARRITILSSTWGGRDERAFVIRNLAGAASRVADVDVFVPGEPGGPQPDGLFDLVAVGTPRAGETWPTPDDMAWPVAARPDVVLFDRVDTAAIALAERFAPGATTLAIDDGAPVPAAIEQLLSVGATSAAGRRATPVFPIGLHVPVHPLAAQRRHNGLGFTGYVLVLSDRGPAEEDCDAPPPLAAWLVAAFPRHDVVIVENGVASAWRSRSLRGRVVIDTRTDLWRLVAHALVTVDLGPGELLARECVESLRYGIPVVVPATTAAAELAGEGGGLWYRDPAELVGCVDAVNDPKLRNTLGDQGRRFADDWYGNADRFVERVAVVLDVVLQNRQR